MPIATLKKFEFDLRKFYFRYVFMNFRVYGKPKELCV